VALIRQTGLVCRIKAPSLDCRVTFQVCMVPSNNEAFNTAEVTTSDHFCTIQKAVMTGDCILLTAFIFSSHFLWLAEANALEPSEICHFIPGLSRSQVSYCEDYPWLMTSIQRGLQNARDQCRKQFAHYGGLRWNCSTYNSDSVFKPILHASKSVLLVFIP
jgi:hypothetical protein